VKPANASTPAASRKPAAALTPAAARTQVAASSLAAARITPKNKHEKVFTCLKIVNLLYAGIERPVINVGFVLRDSER